MSSLGLTNTGVQFTSLRAGVQEEIVGEAEEALA
jgi:hypothetical protein